jgi:DNA-binding NarL/FixJ family response regulator
MNHGEHIFIVDSCSPHYLPTIRKKLEARGHTIVGAAPTLSQSLDLLDNISTPTVGIFEDLLPGGKSGQQAAQEFRQHFPNAKVIAFSISEQPQPWADRQLDKGIPQEDFLTTIDNLQR